MSTVRITNPRYFLQPAMLNLLFVAISQLTIIRIIITIPQITCWSLEKKSNMTRRRPRLFGISDFSDDIIAEVFKFVGHGHFLFVAGTSRQFHRVYETICGNENDSTVKTTMTSAVESISRLQWARTKGCPWNWRTCSCAAKNGQLGVLQWARTYGCPWDWRTCAYAAGNGHLEVLQWARANGCPWDSSTCANAARNGHLEVLEWAS